jgi:hypothetical protein
MSAAPPSPEDRVKRLVPWVVAVAFLMESLDTTILNTGVPTIAEALHVVRLTVVRTFEKSELVLGVEPRELGMRRRSRDAVDAHLLGALLAPRGRRVRLYRVADGLACDP